MCNIAGYVGDRPAAPILMELIRRQEGLAGGYFTGIATIHNGKLHYAKLTGDLDRLAALTEAAKLPGNIGILHSRSNSGGGDNYAHPFIGGKNGEARAAYIANGTAGCFAHRVAAGAALAEALVAEGYEMTSRSKEPNGRYPTLSDGSVVHMSDLMCQLITRKLEGGTPFRRAMADAFCQLPSEIVGLLLDRERPDAIAWARINYPLSVAFAEHGAYLASAAMAFPEDAGAPQTMPPLSYGAVYRDHLEIAPIEAPPVAVTAPDARIYGQAYAVAEQLLAEGEQTCSTLIKAMRPLFGEAACVCGSQLCYEVLQALNEEGRLQCHLRRVPGAADGLSAPKFFFTMKGQKDAIVI